MATFIVEDGTGIADANSYCPLSYAEAYVDDYYGDSIAQWLSATTQQKERALRVATQYIDLKYGASVSKKKTSTQALSFPRVIDSVVPIDVQKATIESMLLVLTGYDLLGVIDEPCLIASEKVVAGAVATEESYVGGKSQIPSFPKIDRLMQSVIGNCNMLYRG